jgi:hypothetical protein
MRREFFSINIDSREQSDLFDTLRDQQIQAT